MAPYVRGFAGASDYVISEMDAKVYNQRLQNEGPDPGFKRADPFLWFPVRAGEKLGEGLVTSDYNGKQYVLLSNEPQNVMRTVQGQNNWGLDYIRRTQDERGRPAIGIEFDAVAASMFAQLTSAHRSTSTRPGDHMSIVINGEVRCDAVILSTISDSCQISGNFTEKEVQDIINQIKNPSAP